jgi:hypothetical protein
VIRSHSARVGPSNAGAGSGFSASHSSRTAHAYGAAYAWSGCRSCPPALIAWTGDGLPVLADLGYVGKAAIPHRPDQEDPGCRTHR